MTWTIDRIKRALGDKLIGNHYMQKMVCETLLFLPPKMIDHVCQNIWFISSPEDSWAFAFKGSEIKHRSLIFLSDELFKEHVEQIRYTILHEVGHVILNHKNSIGYEQTAVEIKKQELEADTFAKEYLTYGS